MKINCKQSKFQFPIFQRSKTFGLWNWRSLDTFSTIGFYFIELQSIFPFKMATHFDHDPAEKNSIRNAAKTEESQMEIVDKIWTNIVKEWRPQSEVMFLRYSGFALPFLSIIPAYEVGKLGIQYMFVKYMIGCSYNGRPTNFLFQKRRGKYLHTAYFCNISFMIKS